MKDELVKTKINGLGQIAHVFGIPNKTGLLFVHGGPGNPNRHKIKDKLSPLFDKFLVCAYDQRGTGGSYHAFPKKADYSIESYVEDILTWGRLIKRRYSLEKLILVGESWGSAISVLSLAKANGLFDAYLGYGQFVVEKRIHEGTGAHFAPASLVSFQCEVDEAKGRTFRVVHTDFQRY